MSKVNKTVLFVLQRYSITYCATGWIDVETFSEKGPAFHALNRKKLRRRSFTGEYQILVRETYEKVLFE